MKISFRGTAEGGGMNNCWVEDVNCDFGVFGVLLGGEHNAPPLPKYASASSAMPFAYYSACKMYLFK